MDRSEFQQQVAQFFDGDSHQNAAGRIFSPSERSLFLTHLAELWDKASIDLSPIDLQSSASIAAMMRAQKTFDSMQDVMAAFPQFYQEEVTRKQGKKV